jgi:hypothetical protein
MTRPQGLEGAGGRGVEFLPAAVAQTARPAARIRSRVTRFFPPDWIEGDWGRTGTDTVPPNQRGNPFSRIACVNSCQAGAAWDPLEGRFSPFREEPQEGPKPSPKSGETALHPAFARGMPAVRAAPGNRRAWSPRIAQKTEKTKGKKRSAPLPQGGAMPGARVREPRLARPTQSSLHPF